jgi:hypothetical protein
MTEKWTEVISPKRSLNDINLKEIWLYQNRPKSETSTPNSLSPL